MNWSIQLGTQAAEKKLRLIMQACGMDLASAIEDHLVIYQDGQVCGGALLFQLDVDYFHLLTIAVEQNRHNLGLGSILLQQILRNPWAACRDAVGANGQAYRITTVARGSSHPFYLKNGLHNCSFSELSLPYAQQCQDCPDHSHCGGKAMSYQGTGL